MNLMVSPANKVFQDKLEYQGNKVLQENNIWNFCILYGQHYFLFVNYR